MPEPRPSDVATTVRTAWEHCLERQDVPDEENFFQAGGNSLEGAELMAALSRTFGRRLRLGLLIRNPTLRGLTEQVEHMLRNDLAPAVRTPTTGTEGGA
ncbi:acyl carrier protein [Amycolatopsis mediterranei]|uniref:acyl carrier protein n=1 Tax=Amycolatopsis mediterranei TaxID=33910 RepID=UPI00343156BA